MDKAPPPLPVDVVFDGIVFHGWELKVPDGCRWFLGWTDNKVEMSSSMRRRVCYVTVAMRFAAKGWKRARAAGSARAWRAKDRAWRWYCNKTGRRFSSLHRPAKLSRAERARLADRLRRT